MDLKALKSGTDIRGTAIPGYGSEVLLTDEAVTSLVKAFVVFVNEKFPGLKEIKIAVGHDSRLSSEHIKELTITALKRSGCNIYDCGLCSTPSMFMMTKYPDTLCDGAIMITASHHPIEKNGLKFFLKTGGLESSDISTLIAYAEEGKIRDGQKTLLNKRDFLKDYCDTLIKLVRDSTKESRPLEGLKIVVDAGNGAGGFFASRVLEPLGANTDGSQFLDPDGTFPNHSPNPEDRLAMSAVSRCVTKNGADLGIIFDTDVDRAAVVAADGTEINRNRLIALISGILLGENKGAYIVTDSVTSDGLRKYIERRGGFHHRFKRGYKNVINEALELNRQGKDAVLAIETSGHAAFRENYFLDDGAYLVTRLLIKMAELKKEGKDLLSLISDLEIPLEEAETRLTFKTDEWKEYGDRIIKELTEVSRELFTLELSTYEGVRTNIDYAKGWFLARMSVHDPIMAINIESQAAGGVKKIAKFLYEYLLNFRELDAEPLKKLL